MGGSDGRQYSWQQPAALFDGLRGLFVWLRGSSDRKKP